MRPGHVYLLPRGLAILALTLLWWCLTSCSGAAGRPAQDGGQREQKEQDAIPVQVTAVKREPLSSLYSTSATLRADKSATIAARTRGVIRKLLVEEGDRVSAGVPVAVLEDDEQTIAFERARSTRDTRRRELERAERLHSQQLLSDEEFENTRREANEAEHGADLAELELSRTTVRAPFAGTILKRYLDVGATVSDGTPVYDLADLNPLYADVNVPERHVARLEVGQFVRLTPDAGGEVVEARIERIAPSIDPTTGTVKVTLAVDAPARMRPGAFMRVDIVTDTRPDALVVPRAALVAEGRRWHLFRLDEDGEKVEQLEVTLGFEEGDRVEVSSVRKEDAVLEPGALVVNVGASALSDGAKVRVIETSPADGANVGS